MKRDPRPDPPLDLQDLRAFCAVADLGSITGAARSLGEAKGSVSRRLTRLETRLGVALLQRSPRLVQITDEGLAFRDRLRRALALIDEAHASVRHVGKEPKGRLRITAPVDLALRVLAPIVSDFCRQHREVRIEMLMTEAHLDFDTHRIDVALRAARRPLGSSSLVARPLAKTRGRFFAAPLYVSLHGAPRTVAELASHRVLLAGPARLTLQRDRDARAKAVDLTPFVAANDFAFIRELALAGTGVALLPELLAAADVRAGRLQPVLPDITAFSGTLYLLRRVGPTARPAVRAFVDFAAEAIRRSADMRAF